MARREGTKMSRVEVCARLGKQLRVSAHRPVDGKLKTQYADTSKADALQKDVDGLKRANG